jgi:tRNA wybutosine-synthesizing protein 3
VLHVTCRNLDAGRALLRAANEAGFRNSGLNVSAHHRVTVAIRAAPSGLDVPVASRHGEALALLVDRDYLDLLLRTANTHMRHNQARLDRLSATVRDALESEPKPKAEETWEPADVRRERKRREGLEAQRKRNEQRRHELEGPDPDARDATFIKTYDGGA